MFPVLVACLRFMTARERTHYFLLVTVRALTGILDVLGIALVGLIAGLASSSITKSAPMVVLGFKLPTVTPELLLALVGAVLALFLLKAILAIGLSKALTSFLAKIETEKAVEVVNYLFTGDLNLIQGLSKAEIFWGVTGSVATAFSGQLVVLSTLISEGLLLILVAVSFALVDPTAALFVVVYFAGIIFLLQMLITRSLKHAGQNAANGGVESTTSIEDLLNAFREITVLDKTSFFVDKFQKAREKLAKANASMLFLSGLPRYVVETALMLGVVAFVGFQFLSGQLTTGFVTVGVFLTGGVRIMASLLPLQAAVANSKSQSEQALLGLELYTASREIRDLSHDADRSAESNSPANKTRVTAESPAVGIQFQNVSYKYPGADGFAIENVSIEIMPGKHVALIGPSGAGKTTLVDLMLGLMKPTIGEVSFFGTTSHSTEIAYVPQNPGLVSGSIAENIALGIPISQIDRDRVVQVLQQAHLWSFVSELPEGIDASVGKQSDAFSGGQIQRLGLARALYPKPTLLILDEATSALDASAEAAITSSLKSLGSSVTVVTIAHRLSTVQHSDVVFVIENGAISAQGSFQELRATVPMVAEYVRLMSFEEKTNKDS